MKVKLIRNNVKLLILVFITAIFFISCTREVSEMKEIQSMGKIYPKTIQVNKSEFEKVFYVSPKGNDSNGGGTMESPFATIKKAVSMASGNSKTAVIVGEGIYLENDIKLANGTSLFGGFSLKSWTRDVNKYTTTIDGEGKSRIIIAADNLKIDGFTITGGKIRDKGGAIYFKSVSPKISNNIFINNITLKPIPWNPKFWHETANDGGAVYFEDNASPVFENNLFVKNKTENGRGAAIGCNDHCSPVFKNNVFVKNTAGLDDPMRSSDGGAISVFDWGNATVENNIFLSNTSLNHNDAGALFLALWTSAKVDNNLFVDSESGDDAGALFVGGQEHRYNAPLDPLPPADKFYVSITNNKFIGNCNGSKNSGATRITMESRGQFANNITAFNNGIYFQRSEIAVDHNIILDNFLFIETKKGLKLGSITNNVIWADFDLEVDAKIKNNNMRDLYNVGGNYSKEPKFKNDGIRLKVFSTNWTKKGNYSKIYVPTQNFKKDELVNRIVKSGDRYSVVIGNEKNTVQIWGDFPGVTDFEVLPTYTLVN